MTHLPDSLSSEQLEPQSVSPRPQRLILALGISFLGLLCFAGGWWTGRSSLSKAIDCPSAFSNTETPKTIDNLTFPLARSFTVLQGEPQRYEFKIDRPTGLSYHSTNPKVCLRIILQDVPGPVNNLANAAYLKTGNYYLDLSVPQGEQKFNLNVELHELQMSAHAMVYALQEYDTTQDSLKQLGQGFQKYADDQFKAQQQNGEGATNEDLILQAYLEPLTTDEAKSTLAKQVQLIFSTLIGLDRSADIFSWKQSLAVVQGLYGYQIRLPENINKSILPDTLGILNEQNRQYLYPPIYATYLKIIEQFLNKNNIEIRENETLLEAGKNFSNELNNQDDKQLAETIAIANVIGSNSFLEVFKDSPEMRSSSMVATLYYETLKNAECDRNWSLLSEEYRQNEFGNDRNKHGAWCRERNKDIQWSEFQKRPLSDNPNSDPDFPKFIAIFKPTNSDRHICETVTLKSEASIFKVTSRIVFQNIDQNSSCSFN